MYGDSQALSLSKEAKESFFTKSQDLFMDSYTILYQNNQKDSRLLRYRSAPGSLFGNLTEGLEKSDAGNTSHETQGFASRLISSSDAKCNHNIGRQSGQVFQDDHQNKSRKNGCYGMMSNSQLPPQYPRQAFVGSLGMDHQGQATMGSNLMRQNSSPAGLFSHLTSQNDYATMSAVGGYRVANSGQMNYSSGLSSSLGTLSRISEVESENGGNSGADEKASNENRGSQFYTSGFPFGSSWNNSSNFGENLSGLKREVDGANYQSAELGMLSHHLSLPNGSAEMSAMEKLLHFQDTVPCKIRAKRGFATHPRSIAERVRRTRISERMRKLQELVPHMDKQTNTADMLDLAVEYIKDLRMQYKTLADIRSKCKCVALQKPVLNQTS